MLAFSLSNRNFKIKKHPFSGVLKTTDLSSKFYKSTLNGALFENSLWLAAVKYCETELYFLFDRVPGTALIKALFWKELKRNSFFLVIPQAFGLQVHLKFNPSTILITIYVKKKRNILYYEYVIVNTILRNILHFTKHFSWVLLCWLPYAQFEELNH